MVSFWPWRGDDSSPASFEKALSALATKITNTQAQLDRTRSTSRRIRVLWSIYLSFAYLVYAIVLVLVIGWKHMGRWEWTGIAGGPVLIYVTRTVVSAFFNYRIESLSARLDDQQGERAKTIQKLKDATKYESTQELLEKYGGVEAKPGKGKRGKSETESKSGSPEDTTDQEGKPRTPGRTQFIPPPTANIPRGNTMSSSPSTPNTGASAHGRGQTQKPQSPMPETSEEFAPNAFGPGSGPPIPNPQYAPTTQVGTGEHWYDRIMDLLLGEDETAAKNRIVLICKKCRLVNGQAPPGTKALSELGMWKCMACGSLNGEMDEGAQIVRDVLGAARQSRRSVVEEKTDDDSSDVVEVEKEENGSAVTIDESAESSKPEAQSGPRKRKGKGKN